MAIKNYLLPCCWGFIYSFLSTNFQIKVFHIFVLCTGLMYYPHPLNMHDGMTMFEWSSFKKISCPHMGTTMILILVLLATTQPLYAIGTLQWTNQYIKKSIPTGLSVFSPEWLWLSLAWLCSGLGSSFIISINPLLAVHKKLHFVCCGSAMAMACSAWLLLCFD